MFKKLELIIFFGVLTALCMSGALAQEVNASKGKGKVYGVDFDQSERIGHEEKNRHHLTMSKEQKKRIKKGYEKFKSLSLEEQERLKERWGRFKSLPEDQQEMIKKKHERLQKMSKDDRQELKRRYRRWDDLSPEQRQRLKDRRKSFRNEGVGRGKKGDKQFYQRKSNKLERKSNHRRDEMFDYDKSKWLEKKQRRTEGFQRQRLSDPNDSGPLGNLKDKRLRAR